MARLMREGWAWAVPAPTPGVLIPRTDQAVVTAVAMGVVRVMEAPPVTGVVPALAWATVVSVATGPGPVTVRVMGVVPGTKEALVMDAAPVTEVVPALAWATAVSVVTDPVPVTVRVMGVVPGTEEALQLGPGQRKPFPRFKKVLHPLSQADSAHE